MGLGPREQPGRLFLFKLIQVRPLQCAERQGLGHMMSHNGSIPPIHVPPGYSSQVLKTVEQSPGELVTHTPVFSPSEPASQCAFLRVPKTLLPLNGRCVSVAYATRVLSGCGLSWYSWSPGTNVSAQGAVFLCGLHLWHLMGLRGG